LTDAPERPLIVAAPCQSEIKRTLKAQAPAINNARRRSFGARNDVPFDADGERKVSGTDRVWFRNGGCAFGAHFAPQGAINRKFTPNPINRMIDRFSAI
jgi:hypothetical protein